MWGEARAVFTIVSASLPGPCTIKLAPRRIGIMSPPTHGGEASGAVTRSFVETSEASHPVSFQIETLGILPVSLVKIVLQLLLSHHPFEILRWNCYFLQFHFFVRDVPCVSHDPVLWSQPGQTRWWIAVREADQWPGRANNLMVGSASNDQQSQSNPIQQPHQQMFCWSVWQWSSNNAGAGQ